MSRTPWVVASVVAVVGGAAALYVVQSRRSRPDVETRPFDGSVAFAVTAAENPDDPDEVTTVPCRTVLTVAKAGRTPLVDKDPAAGGPGVYGWTNFPRGINGPGAAAYYAGWLANNGWRQPDDFEVSGHVIRFFGVSDLHASCDNRQMTVTRAVEGK